MTDESTRQDFDEGFIRCTDCDKFCHIIRAETLQRLPREYSGELCGKCHQWMCRIELLERKKGA